MTTLVDFAKMSIRERAAGSPVVWSSTDQIVSSLPHWLFPPASPRGHQPELFPSLNDVSDAAELVPIIRWGDLWINQILVEWRGLFMRRTHRHNEEQAERQMQSCRIAVIVANFIYDVHLIPRIIPTHELAPGESCEPCGLADTRHLKNTFDPRLYHQNRAVVTAWDSALGQTYQNLQLCYKVGRTFYVEFDRFFGQFHQGALIEG